MRDVVKFTLNGRAVSLSNPKPTQTLLDWLRNDARLTGTKEGCAEGDCGACTVVAFERDASDGRRARALNSCILFVPMADGMDLRTVEGITRDGALHPVQRAMVDKHGSQCGFCTPGIVMALYAHHCNRGATDLAALNTALAGNLCRCTGYGPILDAARAVEREAADAVAPVVGDESSLAIAHQTNGVTQRFFAPRSLDELCALAEANPDAVLLGGATDVGLWVTKQGRTLETVISVVNVPDLRAIKENADAITFGAAVRYAEALPVLENLHAAFGPYLRRIGAVQVRESGTIGGNIANGSPIGDMPPALIALGARIGLRRGRIEREIALEDFFLDYGKQDRAPGEVLTQVIVPRVPASAQFGLAKISKRFDQDISALAVGMLVRMDGARVADARLAFGGMAGIPKRARAAEAALVGSTLDDAAIDAACLALARDFSPLTDWRASAAYRLRAAQGVLRRLFVDAPALETL